MLFEEGQPGDYMYVVTQGEVEIRRKVGETERVLAVLPPGDFFGEMAILNARPRSATAVVRVDSRLLVIEGNTFEAMLRARPEIALRIIKALATAPREREPARRAAAAADAEPSRRAVPASHGRRADAARAARRCTPGTAILVPKRVEDIAVRVGLPVARGDRRRRSPARGAPRAHRAGRRHRGRWLHRPRSGTAARVPRVLEPEGPVRRVSRTAIKPRLRRRGSEMHLADERGELVVLAVDERLDLGRHLTELLNERRAASCRSAASRRPPR